MSRNPLTAGLAPAHPGAILREDVLPALGLSKAAFARLIGLSRQNLYGILGERLPVSVPTALKLGKVIGNGPELWANLQLAYDLDRARHAMAAEIAALPTLDAA